MQMVQNVIDIAHAFMQGWQEGGTTTHRHCIHNDRELRKNMTDHQLDKMLSDTFPASDPVTHY